MSANDIFSQMFGGSGFGFESFFGGGGGNRRPTRGEDITSALNVTLEDLYNGKKQKMAVTRKVVCTVCKGTGGKNGVKPKKCEDCQGRGIKFIRRQIGPNMIQQMQTECPTCQGRGETLSEKDKCTNCHGNKVVTEKKVLQVEIEPGMNHGQHITFRGESDQEPGMEAGDIIFILQQRPHSVFKRDGADLYMEKSIPLIEALTGTVFEVIHLDKRQLIVKSDPHTVIKPGDTLMVAEEGMPILRKPYQKGNLIIKFDIIFPVAKEIDAAKAQMLAKCLPPRNDEPIAEKNAEHVTLVSARKTQASQKGYYDEEDDEDERHGAPRGVQCSQQ